MSMNYILLLKHKFEHINFGVEKSKVMLVLI